MSNVKEESDAILARVANSPLSKLSVAPSRVEDCKYHEEVLPIFFDEEANHLG